EVLSPTNGLAVPVSDIAAAVMVHASEAPRIIMPDRSRDGLARSKNMGVFSGNVAMISLCRLLLPYISESGPSTSASSRPRSTEEAIRSRAPLEAARGNANLEEQDGAKGEGIVLDPAPVVRFGPGVDVFANQ